MEGIKFMLLAFTVKFQVRRAQVISQALGTLQAVKGALPGKRHLPIQFGSRIILTRGRRIEFVRDAVVNTRKDRRQGKVGVGIGSRDPVLKPTGLFGHTAIGKGKF